MTGDYDKSLLRRYVQRSRNRFRYCYAKELFVKSSLQGTVTAEFTFGADGKVNAATASGVDANVAACVAGGIKAREFPPPKAGAVTVRYPLSFRPGTAAATKK
ncbi:MAG: AgmX/PglI C-terminal domain-containing protein [Kofleriaceae bacterium]|nr:AgmX/PglI C-terminal domain-containing protein [Kofleriaceae bacterium]